MSELERAYRARVREVEQYVERYRLKFPRSTKRDACLEYLKVKGLLGLVPEKLRGSA